MSVDAGPGGRCNARRRAREPFPRAARALSVVRLRGARTRLQIRVREGEYVTFVRILTLMYRSGSIFAGRAAIFVTVYRGATLNHQGGLPLRRRSSDQEPEGFASRLRSVIDAHGGASALARVIARSEGAVRKWLRAESEPNVTDLRAICAATATDIAWLVSGKSEPVRIPSTPL